MTDIEQTTEVAGADVEAAIAKGLAHLGVERGDVEIEVLDEGKRGVLGLGAREARVRLTLKPETQPPLEAEDSPAMERTSQPTETEKSTEVERTSEEQEKAQVARNVLLELLGLMGLESVRIDVRRAEPAPGETNPPWILNVHGSGTDALIGRRGKTMAALQRITRLIVGRELAEWVHLVVDVEGFKARREKSLQRLAIRMAKQALETDRRVVLEPMPPHERRVIHLALRNHPNVVTESIGEGNRRKVTIVPR